MSEFIAEAKVSIVPDFTRFRAELRTQLAAATARPLTIPVIPIVPKTATATATAAAAALTTENQALSRSFVEVAGAQATYQKATASSTAATLGMASASSKLDAALLGLRTALGSSAVIGLGAVSLAAILAGTAIRKLLIDTADFQREISTFGAVTGTTADELERVSRAAEDLGRDVSLPAVSAADAAVAMTELAKAGLSVEEAIDGARGVLLLATAAQISNAEAAQLAANALNSFGLAGDQAVRVADDLANAANAAQGSISDIGIAFQQVSAVARQVGLSLEDTTAILSLFAKNGLQGSDAGTSLRVALIRLVAPTQQAAAEIKALGLQIRDAQGNVRPDVFAQFGEATRNLTPAARDAAAALIFGQDAIRAVAIGAREGEKGLRLMQFQIDQTGTAAEVAGARTQGLAGEFSALTSNLQTLGIEIGSLISGPLTLLLKSINTGIAGISDLVAQLQRLQRIKIPDIHIPIHLDFPDLPGGGAGQTIAGAIANRIEGAIPLAGPVLQVGSIVQDLENLARGSDKAKEKVAQLNAELRGLQQARVAAELGGATAAADTLTRRINALKDEIARTTQEGKGIKSGITDHIQEAIDKLISLRDIPGADRSFINQMIRSLREQLPILQQTEGNIARLRAEYDKLAVSVNKSKDAVGVFTANLATQFAELQAAGASPGALLANLNDQLAEAQERQRNLQQKAAQGRLANPQQRLQQVANQITDFQRQIENITKDQEQKVKEAADKIKKAQDAQDQAFLNIFGGREERAENAIERAGSSTLKRQLAAQKALLVVLTNELIGIQKTLKDAKLKAKELARVTKELIQTGQEIARIRREQKKALEQAAADRAEQLERGIQLDIEFAQITGNRAAEIAARNREIAFLQKRINALKKKKNKTLEETNEIKELRNAIAEQKKALKELGKEQDDASRKFKELTFKFLQTQAGFAANLLGNLIPGGATAGLVGGQAGPRGPGTQDPFAFTPDAAEINTGARGAAAVASARERGVRPIQVDTTNQLLRQILRVLQHQTGRMGHPEARYQKATGSANFDTQ